MKCLLGLTLFSGWALLFLIRWIEPAAASPDFSAIADAIYRAEGPHKPYGILSVRCEGKKECRKVCLNTVRNTHRRWVKRGRRGNFIDFLADRYCPPSVDPVGNRNWKRNVKKILHKKKSA